MKRLAAPTTLVVAGGLSFAAIGFAAEPQGQAAKPAPATPVPAEPGATTASFGDWVLRCQRTGEAEKATRVCEVVQSMQVQGQSAPIAQVAIGKLRGEPLRVTVVLPVRVSFPSSVQIQSGEKAPQAFDLTWRRCLPGGCFADGAASDDLLKRWRATIEPGRITFKDATTHDVALPLSFRGLAQALDALSREVP